MDGATTPLTLGSWRVGDLLGEGAFATVHSAEHTLVPGGSGAIKILRRELSLRAPLKQRFLQEATAASRAAHPNIVAVLDAGIAADGTCYLVMERLRGQTLTALLQQGGALPLRQALRIAVQIAAALAHAHAQGIVHRDLKPDNLLLTPRGAGPADTVKVLDFGVAQLRGEGVLPLTRTGTVLGTPAYMPPEQLGGEAVDGRCDIYALGVILFECLSGERPYGGENVYGLALAHAEGEAPLLCRPDLPREVARLVQRMLARRRDLRPPTMAEVAGDLLALEQRLDGFDQAPTQLAPVALTRIGGTLAAGKDPAWNPGSPEMVPPVPSSEPMLAPALPEELLRGEPAVVPESLPSVMAKTPAHQEEQRSTRPERGLWLAAVVLTALLMLLVAVAVWG